MSEHNKVTGRCLCGAVNFSAAQSVNSVGACHCSMCRKWGGGPFLEVSCGSDIHFDGEENIRIFDSSAWAERVFCKCCGSHLFYRLKADGLYMVAAGLFDDESAMVLASQVFIDEKPAFYDFANHTRNITGEKLFSLYSGPQ